jgi:hypothetical protein
LHEPDDRLARNEHLPVEVRNAGQYSPAHKPADCVLGELEHLGRLGNRENHRLAHLQSVEVGSQDPAHRTLDRDFNDRFDRHRRLVAKLGRRRCCAAPTPDRRAGWSHPGLLVWGAWLGVLCENVTQISTPGSTLGLACTSAPAVCDGA